MALMKMPCAVGTGNTFTIKGSNLPSNGVVKCGFEPSVLYVSGTKYNGNNNNFSCQYRKEWSTSSYYQTNNITNQSTRSISENSLNISTSDNAIIKSINSDGFSVGQNVVTALGSDVSFIAIP